MSPADPMVVVVDVLPEFDLAAAPRRIVIPYLISRDINLVIPLVLKYIVGILVLRG